MEHAVADSGVIIKWFVDEPHQETARRIRDDFENETLELLAPDLIYAEFGNIVWKKQVFQGLPAADAQLTLAAFRGYELSITPASDLLDDAYRIAIAHHRTVYDSLYLALSLRAGCRFVTADEKFVNAVGAAFPNVVWLPNWS